MPPTLMTLFYIEGCILYLRVINDKKYNKDALLHDFFPALIFFKD